VAGGAPQKAGLMFNLRVAEVWAIALGVSVLMRTHTSMVEFGRRGMDGSFGYSFAFELTSHLVIVALLPALYWLQKRWPITDLGNAPIYLLAIVPFSLAHSLGMAALRWLWFTGIVGAPYRFPFTLEELLYELAKDVLAFAMLNLGVAVIPRLLAKVARITEAVAPPPPVPAAERPQRYAVRAKGREVLVEVADIDWIEAAGNYAVLHVKGETLEIRSSLARLESELDPQLFVRVHKSHIVNITRVAEVTPWVSGDWRIRLQDGSELNLSRRYRQKFEALAPVRS
jgi:hypothetical protein